MHFESFSDFLAMGGYGFYVWLAVAFSFISIGTLILATILRRRAIIREIQNKHNRAKRMREAESLENTL